MLRITFTLIGILLIGFTGWHMFYNRNSSNMLNDSIVTHWAGQKEEVRPAAPAPIQTETNESSIPLPVRKPEDLPKIYSASNPMTLTSRRNFITGREITYIIPDDMKSMELNIQESNGKTITSYNLPHWAISVKPKQRIQLKVK